MKKNKSQNNGVPKGWVETKLGNIVGKVIKVTPKEKPKQSFCYIDIAAIDNTQQKIVSPKKYLGKDAPSRARQLIKKDDILFSTVRTYLRNIAVVPPELDGQVASTGFCVIRPCDCLFKPLFRYFVQVNSFVEALNRIQRGTSYPAVRNSDVYSQIVPLPPLAEQKRIVGKIEELFSDLDAGVAALKKVRAEIKRYRQAVLKHAFEGKLTAKWRQKNKDKIEPASKLLERIKAEREKLLKRRKCKVLPLESDAFPIMPDGWGAAILNEYCLDVKDGTHDTPKYIDKGIPFVTQKNIRLYGLDISNVKYISKTDHEDFHRRSNVEKSDIIISMIGANRGMSCIVNTDEVFSIKNVGLLKPFPNLNNLKYLDYYIKSQLAQKIILARSRGGAQQFIGLTELRSWAIIIPPLPEQEQIVSEVERRFSIADNAEKIVEQALKQAGRLRQSILKRAFEGKLVPQDANDEPAEKLLERIKKERK